MLSPWPCSPRRVRSELAGKGGPSAMSATCSILVVEDDAGVRTALADALDLEGFEVRLAANGRDALGVLGRWRPDLILTDLDMPIMDGWSLRDELRRRADLADIPVIVLSAALWDRD